VGSQRCDSPDNQCFEHGAIQREVKPFSTAAFCFEEGMHLLFDALYIAVHWHSGDEM
jgi:hypothetical protein